MPLTDMHCTRAPRAFGKRMSHDEPLHALVLTQPCTPFHTHYQTELRRVVAITKKYEIRLLRHACERFLEEAQLSAHSADPNYVLTWLLVGGARAISGVPKWMNREPASAAPWCNLCNLAWPPSTACAHVHTGRNYNAT